MNKYTKWYSAITTNAKQRQLDSYTERHHILPESLGGPDTVDNLVDLTAREHFICHWLLTKIYSTGEEHWKMLNALRMMRAENPNQKRYQTKITGRVYAKLKEEYSILQSERVSGKNNPMYGNKFYRSKEGKQRQREAIAGEKNLAKSPEARQKISESKLGKKRTPFDEVWLDKLSQAKQGENNPRYGVEVTEETRKKIGDKIRGRKHTEEEKKRRADAIRGLKRQKRLCPHCLQLIAVNTYARWHGDHCKTRQTVA
jgi:hypothetical protein